jgi:protein SCO1/2
VLGGCGASAQSSTIRTSSPSRPAPSGTEARAGSEFDGGLVVNPPVTAPPLTLSNYTGGAPVSLASMRGRAVFVTFVYTQCPNVCPLIVSSLAAAQRSLGAAAHDATFIAVTIDPRRDTPAAVHAFLAQRGALGRVYYLLGSRRQLVPVWRAWHVTILPGPDASLSHSSEVYGISGRGKIRILYPANFTPQQIVHDVRLLARS